MEQIIDYVNGNFVVLNSFGKISDVYQNELNNVFVGKNNINCSLLTKFVGILHVSSKSIIKNGITKNGMCKKKFTPFMKHLPKIVVKTNRIETGPDEYVVVRFEKMELDVMHCEVDMYLGQIGEYQIDLSMTKYLGCCHWINKYNKNFANLVQIDTCADRIDCSDDSTMIIYSIDPVGCVDIDDAIHIKQYDTQYEIGIHIADVSSYIEEGSIFDIELSKRVETLYYDNPDINPIHMIPECLSLKNISLNVEGKKRTFSVIITLDNNFDILNVDFKRLLVKINKNLSYEQAEKMIQIDINIKNMYEIGSKLKQHISSSFNDKIPYDIHQMIEVYMIMANKLVAEKLIANDVDNSNALLRSQNSKSTQLVQPTQPTQLVQSDEQINLDLIKKYELSKLERAVYQLGVFESRHSNLNLEYYTHFTSPMRRYADIMVHRQLEKKINGEEIKKISLEKLFLINFYSNYYKKVSRYSNLIFVAKNLPSVSEYDCNVILIKNNGNIRLHISELKLDYDHVVIDKKINNIIEITNLNDDMIILENIITKNKIIIKLFQKLRIKIVKLEKSMEKINISIIDPNIYFLLDL